MVWSTIKLFWTNTELPDASIKNQLMIWITSRPLKTVAEERFRHTKMIFWSRRAFTSAGMDSSLWTGDSRHTLQIFQSYYEYKTKTELTSTGCNQREHTLINYKQIWGSVSEQLPTREPSMISSKTGGWRSEIEFALGEAVFYQEWYMGFYNDIKDNEVADEDMGMLPIYIGVDGERKSGTLYRIRELLGV